MFIGMTVLPEISANFSPASPASLLAHFYVIFLYSIGYPEKNCSIQKMLYFNSQTNPAPTTRRLRFPSQIF